MQTNRITLGLVIAGPAQDVISFRQRMENEAAAAGLMWIFAKTTVHPRRLLIVEDGPPRDNGNGGGP